MRWLVHRQLACIIILGVTLALFDYGFRAFAIQSPIPVELEVPDTVLNVTGKAAPNALVAVSDGGVTVSSVAANNLGDFSATLNAISPGLHNIGVRYTDANGLTSRLITKSVSVKPQQINTLEVFLPPTLSRLSPANLTVGSLVQFRGYTVPNSEVLFRINNKASEYRVLASSSGSFEMVIDSTSLKDGKYSINAYSVLGNETSELSSGAIFTLLPVGQSQQPPDIIVAPSTLSPPNILQPKNQAFIDGSTVTLEGTATPGSQINIYENGVWVGSVFADSNGKWQYIYTATFSPVTLYTESCIGGSCSLLSEPIILNFALVSTCPIDLKLQRYRFFGIKPGEEISLEIETNSKTGKIKIDWGDDEKTLSSDILSKVYKKAYLQAGQYTGAVTLESGSCEETVRFTVDVVEAQTADEISKDTGFFILLGIISALLVYRVVRRPLRG